MGEQRICATADPVSRRGERAPGAQPHVNSTVFEVAASLGEVRLQGMPQPNLGPTHATPIRLTLGRGMRGHVTLGERCRIIAPITSQAGLDTLREDISAAPVDLVEWRVDLYEPFREAPTSGQRFEALERGLACVLEYSPVPVLATIRTSDEGGEASLAPEEYLELVVRLAKEADAVDVQIAAPAGADHVHRVIRRAQAAGAVVVASHHNFVKTPPEEEIFGRLYEMRALGADIVKVAYRVDGPADALAVMNAQMRARSILHIPVVAIGMGGAGALTRIGGSAIGSAATFAVVSGASAPGQLNAHAVREALDLLES